MYTNGDWQHCVTTFNLFCFLLNTCKPEVTEKWITPFVAAGSRYSVGDKL